MYFRPKIFLSSTFVLETTRTKIKTFFESVGAEAILYEKDLTPSINEATYRQDITEADFVIFIFDENYGSKTETGKSGTHEEWEITKNSHIPKHVYLKKTDDGIDSDQKEFIESNIKSQNISYYYYKNENDLLYQIKKMTFTVAHDISISKISEMKLGQKVVKKLALNSDYQLALDFIKDINLLKRLHFDGEVDLTRTTILDDHIIGWFIWFPRSEKNIFIDGRMNNIFSIVYNKYDEYMKFYKNKNTPTIKKKIVFHPEINFQSATYEVEFTGSSEDEHKLHDLLEAFLASCSEFESYVFNRKNEFEKNLI